MAIQLALSYLIAGAVALGLEAWLARLHVPQFDAVLIALVAAVLGGLLGTLNLQYSLYLLDLTLSRLASGQPHAEKDQSDHTESFARRWPLAPLFLRVQETEQRMRRYRSNELLTSDLRDKALQQASEAAALAERNRIARELHDSIKQQIFSISVSAAAARAHWRGDNAEDARDAVEDIQHSAHEAQVEMQALLQQMSPAPLESTSLLEALQTQAQALGFRTGASVHVDLPALPENDRLLPGTQEAIFRLVQEAFANVARHARARTVWLAVRTVGQTLRIEVRDDGQGFDTTRAPSGMGLSNLRERTQRLHGSFQVRSVPDQGTTILITIPLLEALPNPAEAARRHYELARADELAKRGYQLCANASFLSIGIGLIGIIYSLNPLWGLGVVGATLVAIYGYASGEYYRGRVASNAGRDSRAALELAKYHYRCTMELVLPASLAVLYLLKVATPLGATRDHWFIIGSLVCLVALVEFSRWRYSRDLERYYRLLSTPELGWELERREENIRRALYAWCIAGVAGLVFGHSLLVLPPVIPAEQSAYGAVIILLLVGIGLVASYRRNRRWRMQLILGDSNRATLAQEV